MTTTKTLLMAAAALSIAVRAGAQSELNEKLNKIDALASSIKTNASTIADILRQTATAVEKGSPGVATKGGFEQTRRALLTVSGASTVGMNYFKLVEITQNLQTERELAADHIREAHVGEALALADNSLVSLKATIAVWKTRNETSRADVGEDLWQAANKVISFGLSGASKNAELAAAVLSGKGFPPEPKKAEEKK